MPRYTRMAHTSASGMTATTSVSESPVIAQVSISAMTGGVHQRRGARSSTRNVSSSGTPVPAWSGDPSRT